MSKVHTLTTTKDDEVKNRKLIASQLLEVNSLIMPIEERKMISDTLSDETAARLNRVYNNTTQVTASVAREALPEAAATIVIYQEALNIMSREMDYLKDEVEEKSNEVSQLTSKLQEYDSPDIVAGMLANIQKTQQEQRTQKPKVDLDAARRANLARSVKRQLGR